jgi:hypothetical protein
MDLVACALDIQERMDGENYYEMDRDNMTYVVYVNI